MSSDLCNPVEDDNRAETLTESNLGVQVEAVGIGKGADFMVKDVSFPEKNQSTEGSGDAFVEGVETEGLQGVANLEGVKVEGLSSPEENQSVELVDGQVGAMEGVPCSIGGEAGDETSGDLKPEMDLKEVGCMVGNSEAPLDVSVERLEDGSLKGIPNPGGVDVEICNETEIREGGVVGEEENHSTVDSVTGCHVQSMKGILDPGEWDVAEEGRNEAPVDVVDDRGGVGAEGLESLLNLEQVEVEEVHDGAGIMEKVVSCEEKSECMANDAKGHDSFDGHLQATEGIVGYRGNCQDQAEVAVESNACEEDSQGTVPQLMDGETEMGDGSIVDGDHDIDCEGSVSQTASVYKNKNTQKEGISVLDSISVDDSINLQAADVRKDSYPADPVEEVQPQVVGVEIEVGDGSTIYSDQEASVAQASLVDGNQNIQDEGNTLSDSVPVDDNVSHQAHCVTNPVVEAEPQVMGRETEMGDGSMMNIDQDIDHKASVLQTPLVDTNQNIQEEGNTVLDLLPVDDTICHQEDHVTTDPNPADPVVEVQPQVMGMETEVGVGSSTDDDQGRDNEASVPATSLVETNQNIQEEGDTLLDSVPVGDTIGYQADPVVEVRPQLMGGETEVSDGSMMDGSEERDHEASVSKTSLVVTSQNIKKDGDTVLNSVSVDHTLSQQAHHVRKDANSTDPVVEVQPQVVGNETEVGDGFLMDVDLDRDHEVSVSRTSLVDTNQNIQEEGNTVLDLLPVDDTICHQEDHVTTDPNPADPVVEVQPQVMGMETEVGVRSSTDDDQGRDHEASVPATSLVETNQNIQEEGGTLLDSVPVADTIGYQADPVVEVRPQLMGRETEVSDGSMMDGSEDRDHEASVSKTSLVATSQNIKKDGDTVLNSVSVDHTLCQQAHHVKKDPNSADPVVEVQHQVVGNETEVGDGFLMDVDLERDHEASVSRTSLVDTNQNIQEEGNTVLDLLPVDDTICHQEDHVTTDPNPADPVVEVQPQVMGMETEVGVGSSTDDDQGRDHEASVLATSLVETNQNIQEEGDTLLDSVPVGDTIGCQADPVVEVRPQLMGGETEVSDRSMMDGSEDRDHEASVSKTSLMVTSQNIKKDGDTVLNSVSVDHTLSQQAHHVKKDPNPADPVVDVQPQVVGNETEVGDGFLMDVDLDRDHEASVSRTSLVDTNQNIQEEGNTVLDLLPVDDTICHQEDYVTTDPNPADPVVEVQPQVMVMETEVGVGSSTDDDQGRDHEASVPATSLVETNQNIQEEGDPLLDSVPVGDTIGYQADPVVEVRPQLMGRETEVSDGSMMDGSEDRDHEASVSKTSLVVTSQNIKKDGDTVLNSVSVDHTLSQQAHHVKKDPNSADPVVEVQPQVVGNETEVGDGFLMDVDLDRDHEASVSRTSLVNTNQNIQEEGNTVLDLLPVDDAICHQEDHVTTDPNPADPVVKVQPQVMGMETEVGVRLSTDDDQGRDHEASVPATSLVETNQNIQEEGDTLLDSVPVGDTIGHEADPVVEVWPQLMGGETEVSDGSMMDGSEDRDHEASVPKTSLVVTSQNVKEDGDTVLNSVTVDHALSQQAHHVKKDPNPADPVVEVQPQVVGNETEVGDGFLMDVDLDSDHEASVSRTSLVDTNQNIQEEGNTVLDLLPVDDTISHQEDRVITDPNPADPVVEAQPQVMGMETEVGVGSSTDDDQGRDHEASVLATSLVETNQNIQEEGDTLLDSVHVGDTIGYQADPDVEVRPQLMGGETEVSDGSLMDGSEDRDHEASVSQISLGETSQNIQENGDTVLNSVPVDDTLSQQAHHVKKDPNLADPVVEVQPQVVGNETEVGDGSLIDVDLDRDHEASVSQTSLVDTNQNILQEGGTILDSVPVEDTIVCQADHVKADPNLADPIVEEHPKVIGRETEGGDGSMMDFDQDRDHEPSVLQMPLVETNENIEEEGNAVLDSIPVDGTLSHPAAHVTEDPYRADPVVEAQPQVMGRDTEVGDVSVVDFDEDRDHEGSVLQTSLVDTNQDVQKEGEAVLDSIPVDDTIGPQADNVRQDPSPADPVVEVQAEVVERETEVGGGSMVDGGECRNQEASVSQMSLVNTNQNIQEEGDTVLDSVPSYDIISHQADHVTKGSSPSYLVVEVKPLAIGVENVVDVGSGMDGDQDSDHQASIPKTFLLEANQNILEEGNAVLNSIPVDDTINHEADRVTEDPSLADMVVEVQNPDSHPVDKNLITREDIITAELDGLSTGPVPETENRDASSVTDGQMGSRDSVRTNLGLAETVVELEALSADTDPVDENAVDRGDIINADANPVVELQSGGTQLINGNPNDKGDIMVVPCSVLEKEDADASSLDEKLMCRGDIVMENSNSVMETSASKVSELSEIQSAVSQGKESVDFLLGENQEIETQLVGSLADGSLGANADGLESSLGGSQNTVMESGVMKKDMSPPDACCEEIQELEAKQEIPALGDMGIVIADEGTDGEQKVQVGEEELLKHSQNTVMEEVKTQSWKSKHTHESSPGGSQNTVMESEVMKKDMSPPDACCEKIQALEAKQEIPALSDMGNVIVDEGTDGEQKVQVGEEELLKGTEKQAIQCVATGAGISVMGSNQHASYFLPPLDKANLSISDLVWGKVKSHPWWPGQIFDPSDASEMALKHQKKDNFLVAYFGDKTFAWCDESQLKPFHAYFSQMEKQSSSDTFVNSVGDILVEVSRRIELGMTCSCLPEEAHANIKYQKVENAGIRDGNVASVLDRSLIVNYFQPDRLLEYIEALAQFPNGGFDRLELVIAQSQLKAFYHSKGYPELPVFTVGGGLMESVAEIPPSNGKRSGEDIVEHFTPAPSDLNSGKGKSRSRESSFNKGKHVSEDGKKQRSVSELTEEENALHLANDGKSESGIKDAEKSISSSGKKHPAVDSDSADSGRRKKRRLDSFGDIESKSPSPTVTSSFKIGECIRRAASQLTGAPPILKCHGETFQRSLPQADHRKGDVSGFDVLPHTHVEKQRTKIGFSDDYSSPNEMLSQLSLAARHPMKGYSFLSTTVAFFTAFRNSQVSSSSEDKKHVEKRKRGRPKKVNSQSAFSDMSTPDHMNDSYWSDMILHNIPRKKLLSNGLKRKGESHMRSQKKRKSAGEPSLSLPSGPMLDSEQHLQVGAVCPNMKHAFVAERSIISVEEKIVDECMPTALILSFNNSKSLPSETDLIRIFSRYGPLKEAETDVLRKTNRAKVIFKRRADAEIAFSSAGKYSFFGPGLLSYRLKDLPSTPNSAPDTTPHDKHDAATITTSKDSHEAAPSTSPQDKHDPAPITTPQDNHDAAPITTPQDNHDAAPITTPQDIYDAAPITPQDNHDAAPITTSQDKYAAAPIEGGNLEVSEQAETGIVSDTIQVEAVGKESSE